MRYISTSKAWLEVPPSKHGKNTQTQTQKSGVQRIGDHPCGKSAKVGTSIYDKWRRDSGTSQCSLTLASESSPNNSRRPSEESNMSTDSVEDQKTCNSRKNNNKLFVHYANDSKNGSRMSLQSDDESTDENGSPCRSRRGSTNGKRRWSNPSFEETSRRVSMLLRMKRNFQSQARQRKESASNQAEDGQHLEDLAPECPRFSSYMSPEAQYALLQGYEDLLRDYLSKKYPEYEALMMRSKTPSPQSIYIRRKSSITGLDDTDEVEEIEVEKLGKGENIQHANSFITLLDLKENKYKNKNISIASTKTGVPKLPVISPRNSLVGSTSPPLSHTANNGYSRRRSDSVNSASSNYALRNIRRLSNTFGGFVHGLNSDHNIHRIFKDEDDSDTMPPEDGCQTSNAHSSCPYVLPQDRRLAMTHKLQDAMDILDTIKAEQDSPQSLLSPRVKVTCRKLVPLSAYSNWSTDWRKEFIVHNSTS